MVKAFALTGRGDSTMRKPQGVASLALGWVLHWAFSPPLLNQKLELLKSIQGDGVQVLYITCATSPCFIAC